MKFYNQFILSLEHLGSVALLFFRLLLAHGFYQPAMMKIKDPQAIAVWFNQMNVPAPLFFAYLTSFVELFGCFALLLGIAARFFSFALIILLCTAIYLLHWVNGFESYANGFEIPLYYIAMLFMLLTNGPGYLSIDNAITKWKKNKLKSN